MSNKQIFDAIDEHPDYKVMWTSGLRSNGIGSEITKHTEWVSYCIDLRMYRELLDFRGKIEKKLAWAAMTEMKIDHENKMICLHGYSENDMY